MCDNIVYLNKKNEIYNSKGFQDVSEENLGGA